MSRRPTHATITIRVGDDLAELEIPIVWTDAPELGAPRARVTMRADELGADVVEAIEHATRA